MMSSFGLLRGPSDSIRHSNRHTAGAPVPEMAPVFSWPCNRSLCCHESGKVKGDEIGYLALAFKVPELESILRARFKLLEDEKKEKFIAAIPVAELSDEAIRIFSESNGWRTAEARAKNLIVPLAQSFTADQVDRMLDATLRNDQIWDAAEIPEILANVFRLTHHLLPATARKWKALLENVEKLRPGGYWNKILAQLESA